MIITALFKPGNNQTNTDCQMVKLSIVRGMIKKYSMRPSGLVG